VVKKLDEHSREALLINRDPETMVALEQKRIHRAILQCVYGKKNLDLFNKVPMPPMLLAGFRIQIRIRIRMDPH
jgi:hypothetical protein